MSWYRDVDEDGFGDPEVQDLACGAPEGFVEDGSDCDDSDGGVDPGQAEVCDDEDTDEDCSGGGTTHALDEGTDCDDADATINPGADEVCDPDDIDEGCDGLADDADDDTATRSKTAWYADSDGDGYGAGAATLACEDPSSGGTVLVPNDDDCDDTEESISPAATEVCDPDDTDEDCDGLVDEEDTVDPDSATRY